MLCVFYNFAVKDIHNPQMFTGKHMYMDTIKSPRVVNKPLQTVTISIAIGWRSRPPLLNIIIRSLPAANLQFTYFIEWLLVDIN